MTRTVRRAGWAAVLAALAPAWAGCSPTPAPAEGPTAAVKGRVTRAGRPVKEPLEVRFVPASGGPAAGHVMRSGNGRYESPGGIPVGSYTVTVKSRPGVKPERAYALRDAAPVEVTADRTLDLEVK